MLEDITVQWPLVPTTGLNLKPFTVNDGISKWVNNHWKGQTYPKEQTNNNGNFSLLIPTVKRTIARWFHLTNDKVYKKMKDNWEKDNQIHW